MPGEIDPAEEIKSDKGFAHVGHRVAGEVFNKPTAEGVEQILRGSWRIIPLEN